MTNVLSKINKLIREKAEKQGIVFPCSNESVTVEIVLSNTELAELYSLDLVDNYNYEIEGNKVIITFSQTDYIFESLSEFKGKKMSLNDLSINLDGISDLDIFEYNSEDELIQNESVIISNSETNYKILFKVIEVNEENPSETIIEVTEIEYI